MPLLLCKKEFVTRAQQERLTFDNRCFTSSVDIFPAPTMATRASANVRLGSFIWQSSAAAELTDTAPLEMEVSARTRLPAVIACNLHQQSHNLLCSLEHWPFSSFLMGILPQD